MLLPFLLDADRRKVDATGAGKVRLEDLMKAGGAEQHNRLGYLWLELVGVNDTTGDTEYLTLGRAGAVLPVDGWSEGLVLHHAAAGRPRPSAARRASDAAVSGQARRGHRR